MKFITYKQNGTKNVGILLEGGVVPLSILLPAAPTNIVDVIAAGTALLIQAESALKDLTYTPVPLSNFDLLPVVPNPSKIICLGLNYSEHAKEGGHEVPQNPTLFVRVASSLAAANADIVAPNASKRVDYEAELALVIGKTGKNILKSEALEYVYGYSAFNDISMRDWQRRSPQWDAGKNFDGSGPFGPALVTADELPAGAKGLRIRSVLNGQTMQDANTDDMVFDVPTIIADISTIMQLNAGDVIVTGTPSGVGFARKPPVYMKAGDVIEIIIDGLPTLKNTVISESH